MTCVKYRRLAPPVHPGYPGGIVEDDSDVTEEAAALIKVLADALERIRAETRDRFARETAEEALAECAGR